MKILAFEFSSEQRSVAVLDNGAEKPLLSSVSEVGQPRNTQAIRMVEEVLKRAQLEREQIECIAVGLGPGSYAGIRATIALAQGWQLARSIPFMGISSVESLAAVAQQSGLFGRIHIAIDAQRNEFYLATYEIETSGVHEIEPLRLVGLADLQVRLSAGEKVAGPQISKSLPRAIDLFPSAAAVAQLAAHRKGFDPGEALEPIYLRETSFVKAPPLRVIPMINP